MRPRSGRAGLPTGRHFVLARFVPVVRTVPHPSAGAIGTHRFTDAIGGKLLAATRPTVKPALRGRTHRDGRPGTLSPAPARGQT